jgi:hypothetical protein
MAKSNRTGGPKTDQGKLASSRNAIKTGSYSSLIILPGESEEDFRLLEEQFFKDFSPQDVAQSAMVRSLAVITWKKLRAEKIEHAGLIRTLSSPFDLTDYHKLNLPFGRHRGDVVLEWIKRLSDSAIQTWAVAIKSAQHCLEIFPTVAQLQALEASSPFLYQYFLDAGEKVKPANSGPSYWASARIKTYDGQAHDFIRYYSDQFLKDHEVETWVIDHLDELKQGIKEMKEARLLRFLQQKDIQRVHDDLDRAFYRTLNELRNHQKWRRDESAIDVTDAEDTKDAKDT